MRSVCTRLLRQTLLLHSRPPPLRLCRIHGSAAVACSGRTTSSEGVPPHLIESFNEAKQRLSTLECPKKDEKVELYALFQQATRGKCDAPRPASHDFTDKAKWDAWKNLKDMPKAEAMTRYAQLVHKLAADEDGKKVLGSAVLNDNEDSPNVRSERNGNVLYICLNRPHVRNALTLKMYDDLALTFDSAAEDKQIAIVVLTGTGEYFSSGNDLANFTTVKPDTLLQQIKEIRSSVKNFIQSLIDFPKPLVAMVNGPAMGISVAILGLCDVVYCTEKATYLTPFTTLGQCPVGCSSFTFPKMMGVAKAGEMLLFNKQLSAQEAFDRNLVTRVFPHSSFIPDAHALVTEYAKLSTQSLQVSKSLMRGKAQRDLLLQINEDECNALFDRWHSKECWDLIMTFVQNKSAVKMDRDKH